MPPILLVRHAESTLNADRVVQYPDTPLSEHGIWQAERLADRLHEEGVTTVVCSDHARAETTARIICEIGGARLTIDPILRERDLGTLRGRAYAEVEGLVFSEGHDPEAGERWADFVARLDRLWEWVADRQRAAPGSVAVVTHGLVCQGLARRHLTVPPDTPTPRFPNASVTIVEPEPPWRVQVLASRSHLVDDRDARPPTGAGGRRLASASGSIPEGAGSGG